MSRTFEDVEAVRTRVPLMIGLVGPSGGGKTMSALRLATGIQRVTGGDIFVVDTEARRSLHYADRFKFRHVQFDAPFSPLDYLQAIEHCSAKGAKVVIVDSMSHEHEGPGGVLEMHEAEMQRLGGGDDRKAEKMTMLAWARPKSERRRMINSILQLPVSAIFCFRAKEKLKIIPGQQPKQLGFMAIAGEEFTYEMTVNCLLLPKADGVPTWDSAEVGEKATMKLPAQFRELFGEQRPLSEEHGETMARWAEGTQGGACMTSMESIARATNLHELEAAVKVANDTRASMSRQERDLIKHSVAAKKAALSKPAEEKKPTPGIDEPPANWEPGSAG